jgi:APA family basic amino acid/polyamine antiporter
MNAGIMDSALPVMAGVKEGWLPQWLAKQNRFGAYYVAIGIIFVIGALPVVSGISVAQIASITMALGALSAILLIISAVNFPFVFEKQWKSSYFHISLPCYFIIVLFCAAAELFVVVKALAELDFEMIVCNILLLTVCVFYSMVKSGNQRDKSHMENITAMTTIQ